MRVFVDTSALLALLDRDDGAHARVSAARSEMADDALVTHAYVVIESVALVRRRLGAAAAMDLIDGLLPSMEVRTVDAVVHEAALRDYRGSGATGPSIVDRTSFAFIRAEGIRRALAVDDDFTTAGFEVLPATGQAGGVGDPASYSTRPAIDAEGGKVVS